MSEPCISKSAHNYNCSLYDTKEELQQLQVTQGIPIFVGIKKQLNINYMEQLQVIQSKIYEIRGQKVMLDKDLAELYQVTTGNLNKAVKRNLKRFPPDFMFQLTDEEW